LAYVLGDCDLRRLTLKTHRRALVPRPETEIVVDRCLALLAGLERPRVVDVGTGSGAIALALAQEVAGAEIHATDVSPDALALAGENAAANGLTVQFHAADLLDGLEGPFDLVVSNPPYVGADEIDALEPEVRDWEPRGALIVEGPTERLAYAAQKTLVLGVHADHAGRVAYMLWRAGYPDLVISRDLAGRD